jgi:hypothetical protein
VSGRRDHTLRLWALVVFELWHRLYLDSRQQRTASQPMAASVAS